MASFDRLTQDHINSFFSLDGEITPIDTSTTLTGGLGLDNMSEFPSHVFPEPRKKDSILYCQKYIDEDRKISKLEEKSLSLNFSNMSLEDLNALELLSTSAGDVPSVNTINVEEVENLCSNYFQKGNQYDSNLAIEKSREQILQLLGVYPCLIIQGPTGCGKTTQVPQYILDQHMKMKRHCNIIVTQPRKIAAISIARRVCEERGWPMGTIVGYQVGMDSKTSRDTRISYVTTGVLLQKLVNERCMDMYTHVIIDEVHERDQDTDFALLIVKKLLRTNSRSVKVVLMSATIDTSIFSKYFSLPELGISAPVIEIPGQSKVVTEHYLSELSGLNVQVPCHTPSSPRIHEELYELVVKLVQVFDKLEKSEQGTPRELDFAAFRGAVLIFLPGYEEISMLRNKFKDVSVSRKYSIMPLHSTITMEEQTSIFKKPNKNYRKIILSTNIAESSITVPDIRYVIDFCLTKNIVCDQDTNYVSLKLEWASKANCIQRKGRAGRVDIGRVYRLVSKDFYDDYLPEYTIPELKRCPLTQTVLATKLLDFGEPQALLALAIDPPDIYDIQNAVLTLKEVGALAVTAKSVVSLYDGDLTFIGRIMASLPLDVKLSKLIFLGYAFGCLEDCIIIAASLSLKSFLSKPFQQLLNSYKSSLSWANGTFSDCLAYLNAFKMWNNFSIQGQFHRPGGSSEAEWAKHNFIQLKRIKEVDLLVKEIKKRLEIKLNINTSPQHHKTSQTDELLIIKIAIAGAFYPHYYNQAFLDEQVIMKEVNGGDPFSTVVLSGLPPTHGVLYYTALCEMLYCCSSRMNIEFEDRKAYVQFDRRAQDSSNSQSTSVLSAVYFAVKLRMLHTRLDLQIYSKQEADKRMEQLRHIQQLQSSANNLKRLSSNRMMVESAFPCVKKCQLPGLDRSVIEIFISHIMNAGHFWARYIDQMSTTELQLLEMPGDSSLQSLKNGAVPGMMVWAPFAQTEQHQFSYYRATVEEVFPGVKTLVQVFFIDYGNSSQVALSELRAIHDNNILNIPAMAFECQLSEVKPSACHSSSFGWSVAATKWFRNQVNGQKIIARIYSVVQGIVRAEVFLHRPDGMYSDRSLNEEMKKLGFAEHAEESLLSKKNYDDRMDSEQASMPLPNDDGGAVHFTPIDLQGLEHVHKTPNKIRLQGPCSPLEASYSGMTYVDLSRIIKIDRDSVNSVSLNSEPQNKHAQLLIAGSVTLNVASNSLNVRSTTLMPRIKGLPELLCLLFAPRAEFRTNPTRSAHTGMLCGLGCDSLSGESLYPEHDIEIDFNTVIDYMDLREINQIRLSLNILLGHCDIVNEPMIERLQEMIRRNLLKLMKRTRLSCEPYSYPRRMAWMQLSSDHILSSRHEDDCAYSDVFPLHPCIDLNGDASYSSEVARQIKNLQLLAKKSTKIVDDECWLCSDRLKSQEELINHLESSKHKKNLRSFKSS